jgi:4-amino-4-deoxy-L-arabinose transferase-like glycosyltransferase
LLLLLVPFVPLRTLFGDIPGATGLVTPGEWLLGLFIFGVVAVLAARFIPASAPPRGLDLLGHPGPSARVLVLGGFVLLGLLLVAVSTLAFARRPLLIDSVVHAFQARIFVSGAPFAPAPPDEAFFAVQHMVVDGGRWYSQYPPGHAGILAIGLRVGAMWLAPVVLSLGTTGFLYAFAARAYDRSTARLTLLVLVVAPFFWFMGASHMNHVSSLFFVSACLMFVAWWEADGGWVRLLLAGLAIGGAFLSRPLTAVAVGAVLAFPVLRVSRERRNPGPIVAGLAGALAAVSLYLAYNAATTGDPFLSGYVRLWGENHGLGFHATPWGDVHTPIAGLRNELTDLSLLAAFAFEWPVPALLPIGAWLTAGWAARRWDRRLTACLLALPAAYLFYWHRDAFLGPRYLYSGLAFMAPLTARAILDGARRLAERPVWSGSGLTRVPAVSVAAILLVTSVLYAGLYAAPRRFTTYRTGLASMKLDLQTRAAASGISDAIVFVPVSWGNRLLARMRAAGVPASLAERVYRAVDHCALELLLTDVETEEWSADRLTEGLSNLPPAASLGAASPNGDPTLRLAPDRAVRPECEDELRYDAAGYGNFTPFLADLDPDLGGSLLVARDLRGRNARLQALYPSRPAFVYRAGRFVPLAPAAD